MNIPGRCTWSWKRILLLRPLALQKISYKVGRYSAFSLWHDPWCNHKPLSTQFDSSLQSALESLPNDTVSYIQDNGHWNLGASNHYLVRDLRLYCSHIIPGRHDEILWNQCRNMKISISVIYRDISLHKSAPRWLDFIWHSFSVPKFAVTSWLILQKRLLTKDRMLRFDMRTDPTCILCATADETHDHLFADCHYTRIVLSACPKQVCSNWNDFAQGHFLVHDCTRFEKQIAYLFLSAAFYAIWKERNSRIFKNSRCIPSSLIAQIRDKVREKLYTCSAFRRRATVDQNAILLLF